MLSDRRIRSWERVVSPAADRWIRWTTTGCVTLLALIAGTVSYLHMHLLVELLVANLAIQACAWSVSDCHRPPVNDRRAHRE
jgi:hypothetical protein